MFARMVGMHRPESLLAKGLLRGQFMVLNRFTDESRYFPPHAARSKGLYVYDMLQFFVLFPLSNNCNNALYGWTRSVSGPLQWALAAPACAALALLQAFGQLMGLLAIITFGVSGTIFCMCIYGDAKVRVAQQ